MQTKVLDPIVRSLSPVLSGALANAAFVGLSRRRRRSTLPVAWLGLGVAIGGAAALFLAPADTRDRLTRLLQRGGGGLGKRIGQLVGEQVGAHPVATSKVVDEVRSVLKPGQS
jgi:hypothetical protein